MAVGIQMMISKACWW